MSSLALLTLTLLGVAHGNPFDPLVGRAQCNYDNCLRVMTNTPSVASSFCSTYLQPTSYSTVTPTITISGSSTIYPTVPTTTVGPVIPAHISSQCALTTASPLTSRLSSACSCISAVPAAGTVTLTSYAPAVTDTLPLPVVCDGVTTPYNFGGKTFDSACQTYYIGTTLEDNSEFSDFPACINHCVGLAGCVAVTFFLGLKENVCLSLSDIEVVYVFTQRVVEAAVLKSYVAANGGLPVPINLDM